MPNIFISRNAQETANFGIGGDKPDQKMAINRCKALQCMLEMGEQLERRFQLDAKY